MNKLQRKAFDEYEDWTRSGCPDDVPLQRALILMLGAMVNYTDGCPTPDEAALMRVLWNQIHREKYVVTP